MSNNSPVSYARSFLAGVDPTGVSTFALAQNSKRHAGHTVASGLGGVVGGLTVLPAGVGAATGALVNWRNVLKAPGLKGKLLAGATALGKGAISPYSNLHAGVKLYRGLGRSARAGHKFTSKQVDALHKLVSDGVGAELKYALPASVLNNLPAGVRKGMLQSAQGAVGRSLENPLIGFGASGALGGGTALLQYHQGVGVGNNTRALRARADGLI